MSFIEALQLLLEGKRLTRKAWPHIHYVFMPIIDDKRIKFIFICDHDHFLDEDILASDWYVWNDPNKG